MKADTQSISTVVACVAVRWTKHLISISGRGILSAQIAVGVAVLAKAPITPFANAQA